MTNVDVDGGTTKTCMLNQLERGSTYYNSRLFLDINEPYALP